MPESEENSADRKLLDAVSVEAGKIALSWFGKDPEVWMKEGDSPVSQADLAVDEYLQAELLKARPDYGWLSEETEDNDDRLNARRTFVVDPIDGTRGFINGLERWCVSVAIVENHRPVVAALNAPVLEKTVTASSSGGATLNGKAIQVAGPRQPVIVTGSRPFIKAIKEDHFGDAIAASFVPSLAWRLAMVAMGEVDCVLARGSARDWDLAAADLIVHEAGGKLTDRRGGKLRYNCPSTRQGTLVAAPIHCQEEMLERAKRAKMLF